MSKDKKEKLPIKQVKELMAAMDEHDVLALSLKHEGFEIKLSKREMKSYEPAYAFDTHPASQEARYKQQERHMLRHPTSAETKDETDHSLSGESVTSPMVGTFYRGPNPDSPPFIKEGDMVTKDTVVCIIEAMKVMNEVKAGVQGKVTKVLIEDGQPVEFGSKIFLIET